MMSFELTDRLPQNTLSQRRRQPAKDEAQIGLPSTSPTSNRLLVELHVQLSAASLSPAVSNQPFLFIASDSSWMLNTAYTPTQHQPNNALARPCRPRNKSTTDQSTLS